MTIDEALIEELTELRHEIHRRPGIARREEDTAKQIAAYIKDYNPDQLVTGIGGSGLAAVFGDDGPGVVIRAELDALPVSDNIDKEYRSRHDGWGHKCGHDGHMVMVAGLAPLLEKSPIEGGRVILLFQPAEETGQGAQAMLDDDKLRKLDIDCCFALHNLPKSPLGQVVLGRNIFTSASRGIAIKLYGLSSHAAHPENGINPFEALCELGSRLKSLPKEIENRLGDFSLVTLIHANMGTLRYGTMPGDGEIHATLRTWRDDDLETLTTAAEELARQIARKHSLEDVDVSFSDDFSNTINTSELVDIIGEAAREAGLDVTETDEPFRWSDDFGYFTDDYPGAYFCLGSGTDQPQLHTSRYDFPDELIGSGLELWYRIAKKTVAGRK